MCDSVPDSKWIYYADQDATGKESLFRIPSSGGQPERLGEIPTGYRSDNIEMRLSPDGRNVLIDGVIGSEVEVWLLENFEPKH
jgi:Tol biopolymer transport system component